MKRVFARAVSLSRYKEFCLSRARVTQLRFELIKLWSTPRRQNNQQERSYLLRVISLKFSSKIVFVRKPRISPTCFNQIISSVPTFNFKTGELMKLWLIILIQLYRGFDIYSRKYTLECFEHPGSSFFFLFCNFAFETTTSRSCVLSYFYRWKSQKRRDA